jgi:hypothetical protein
MYHIRALPVVHLPVTLADHVRGYLGSVSLQADVAQHVGLPVTKNPCPRINAWRTF